MFCGLSLACHEELQASGFTKGEDALNRSPNEMTGGIQAVGRAGEKDDEDSRTVLVRRCSVTAASRVPPTYLGILWTGRGPESKAARRGRRTRRSWRPIWVERTIKTHSAESAVDSSQRSYRHPRWPLPMLQPNCLTDLRSLAGPSSWPSGLCSPGAAEAKARIAVTGVRSIPRRAAAVVLRLYRTPVGQVP